MEKTGIQEGRMGSARLEELPRRANYRIEIAGVERYSNMVAVVDEAKAQNPSQGHLHGEQLDLLRLRRAEEHGEARAHERIEMIMVVGHRKAWDVGSKEMGYPRRPAGPNTGAPIAWPTGSRHDAERGGRSPRPRLRRRALKLVKMRAEGSLEETIFKWSVFGDQCSPAGASPGSWGPIR